MNGDGSYRRRAIDQSTGVVASRTLWTWFERHHIDALAVIVVTIVLTVQVIQWAMDFADAHYSEQGLHIAAIIGAVLTPWGIMQSFLFKSYSELKNRDFPPAPQTVVVAAPVPPQQTVVLPAVPQDQPKGVSP